MHNLKTIILFFYFCKNPSDIRNLPFLPFSLIMNYAKAIWRLKEDFIDYDEKTSNCIFYGSFFICRCCNWMFRQFACK